MTPNQDKYDKHKSEIFEYEDFGRPTLFIASILTVIVAVVVLILFAVMVANGAVAISEALNG